MFLKEKGLTLFTPLVGMALLLITVMIVIGIQDQEQAFAEIDLQLLEQEELSDLSAGLRIDALQSVITGTRLAYARILENSSCDNSFVVDNVTTFQEREPFSESRDRFIENELIGNAQVINRVVQQVRDKLRFESRNVLFSRFSVEFESGEEDVWSEVEDALRARGEEAYEIVECDSERDCPNGSFYILLNLTALSEETFAKLPKVTIKKLNSNVTTTDVLLPRAEVPIYVQFRLFKALATAKEVVDGFEDNKTDLFGNGRSDFSGPQLGMCGSNACSCRINPWPEGDGDELCVDAFNKDGGLESDCTRTPSISDVTNCEPYDTCGNAGFSGARNLRVNKTFVGGNLRVEGKYDCSSPERAISSLTAEAVCAINSRALSEDNEFGSIPDLDLKGSGSWLPGCSNLYLTEEYLNEDNELSVWESVSGTGEGVQGLAFKLNSEGRITNFDFPNKASFDSKRVCLQTCKAFDLFSALVVPSSWLQSLGIPLTGGAPWDLSCEEDRLAPTNIRLQGEGKCSRPGRVENLCVGLRDENPLHGLGGSETDYYFNVTYLPETHELERQKISLTEQRVANAACGGSNCLESVQDPSIACSHTVVFDTPGAEYYPEQFWNSCAVPGLDPCVKDSRITSELNVSRLSDEEANQSCETFLTAIEDCCSDECSSEECLESCKSGQKVCVSECDGDEPVLASLCEREFENFNACLNALFEEKGREVSDAVNASQGLYWYKDAVELIKRACN